MNDTHYKLALIGGTEQEYGHIIIPPTFESLGDCVKFAEEHRINYYLLQVEEFDRDNKMNYSLSLELAMDRFLYSNKGISL